MDALMLLTADHNRVRGLFAKFRDAHKDEDTAEMGQLATRILKELDVHTEVEEQVFYPTIKDADTELEHEVLEGLEEHHVVDILAEELTGPSPGSEEWTAKMTVIIEMVEHHAGEEEQEMFPEVRKRFDYDLLFEMGERMEALKARLGAPTVADKQGLSTEQLKALAREQEVPGRSTMGREELLATVAPG